MDLSDLRGIRDTGCAYARTEVGTTHLSSIVGADGSLCETAVVDVSRRAALVALVLGLAVPGLGGCAPGRPTPCQPTQITRVGQVPSVQASPQTTSIVGVLSDGHPPRAGEPSHIRWLVDARRGGTELRIVAGNQDTNQSFQLEVPRSRTTGILDVYDSTLRFPQRGCWDVEAATGPAQATVTFDVR